MDSDIRTLNVQEEQEMSLHSGSSGKPFSFSWGAGLPGGPVIKNLLCNARDVGLIPGQGTKILHAMEQLSPCVATRAKCSQINKHLKNKRQYEFKRKKK